VVPQLLALLEIDGGVVSDELSWKRADFLLYNVFVKKTLMHSISRPMMDGLQLLDIIVGKRTILVSTLSLSTNSIATSDTLGPARLSAYPIEYTTSTSHV
jgi:hypothetical protein